jgi:alanyl-tRNA synthetase
MIRTTRISDGILRLYYVAGDKTIERLNNESQLINSLTKLWGINQNSVLDTAKDMF